MSRLDEIAREHRLNEVFTTIKKFETLFPDEFEKCNIIKCADCGGTGLKDRHKLTFCSYCGGFGYTGFQKIGEQFICRNCSGYGCNKCNQTGLIDWVTYIMQSDVDKKR